MSKEATIKIALVNLGCPKNLVDSEVMLGVLTQQGFEATVDIERAEVVVINTCGFIDAAKQESINTIIEYGKLKKTGNCRVLIAAGCLSQRYPDELLKDLPELDAVVGTGDFPRIAEISRKLIQKQAPERTRATDSPTYLYSHLTPRQRLSPSHWAYVKISEGCNYRCSFCAIPFFRGDLVSRPTDDIISEVEQLGNDGVKEINLIAQSLTSFGWDRREKDALIPLLKRLVRVNGPRWIRLFYTYPTDLRDDLLEWMAAEPKLCNYVDLPLQHINDSILKRMNRKGSSRLIRDLLGRIREKIPNVSLRSTFIVGFPGETEEDVKEIADLIREVRFQHLGVFTYSHEDPTQAYALVDSVPDEVKAERRQKLLEIQSEIVSENHHALIGTTHEVMIEGPSEEPDWSLEGRMEGQAPEIDGVVYLEEGAYPVDSLRPGDFIKVEITGVVGNDLIGVPC